MTQEAVTGKPRAAPGQADQFQPQPEELIAYLDQYVNKQDRPGHCHQDLHPSTHPLRPREGSL
jgi:hypothetical protein